MANYLISRTRFELATAQSDVAHAIAGNYITISDASSSAAVVEVEFSGENVVGSGRYKLRLGDYIKVPETFSLIKLSNTAQAGAWVEVSVVNMQPAPEEFEYWINPRGTIDSITNPVNVRSGTAGTYGQVDVTTSATQIRAADTTCNTITIQNLSVTGDLWLGNDNSVSSTTGGIRLNPGGVMNLDSAAAWWGISSSGTIRVGWTKTNS